MAAERRIHLPSGDVESRDEMVRKKLKETVLAVTALAMDFDGEIRELLAAGTKNIEDAYRKLYEVRTLYQTDF
jgi:hypothetical protein